MIKKILLTLVICYLLFAVAWAEVEIGGYYRNDFLGLIKRAGGGVLADLNKLRLRIDSKITPQVNIHLEPEYVFLIKYQDLPLTSISGMNQLVWDRTYVKIYFPLADLTVGKQRIAWGTGYLWNPTDVFNPFALTFAVAEEERRGVEAVRLEIPVGVASGFEGVILTGQEWAKTKKGIKGKVNIGIYDFSLSYIDLGEGSSQLGFDMVGELWGLGVRSEVALISPAGANQYIKAVGGWNYTFENGWGVDMECFYNGLGHKNKEDYDWAGLLAGNISQLGMDYVYFGVSKILDELTQVRASFLLNANDLGYIVYPSYTRNILENVDLSLEALLECGEEGSEYNPTPQQNPTGFLGSNLYFLKVRYSF